MVTLTSLQVVTDSRTALSRSPALRLTVHPVRVESVADCADERVGFALATMLVKLVGSPAGARYTFTTAEPLASASMSACVVAAPTGRTTTARSFALGAVAYRALTGRRPFTGQGTPQLLYQVVYGQPVRPREILATIPRDVELVLAVALSKRPESRFPSAAAFAIAMRAASKIALDPQTRAHAEKILRIAPWSSGTP